MPVSGEVRGRCRVNHAKGLREEGNHYHVDLLRGTSNAMSTPHAISLVQQRETERGEGEKERGVEERKSE